MLFSDQITGALTAGDIVMKSGGFSEKEVEAIQVAILEHSTGYWYFRASVKVSDISDRTITLRAPKSGKESESAYIPENISKKLAKYVRDKVLQSDCHRFPIYYSTSKFD